MPRLRTLRHLALLSLSTSFLAGCPSPNNLSSALSVDETAAMDSAVADFNDLADLSGDSSSSSSFLDSVNEDLSTAGVGFSAQSLVGVQDITGNLSTGFTWPQPQSSASFVPAAAVNGVPAWLANTNTFTSVSRNKKWQTTTAYYVNANVPTNKPPFGSERIVKSAGDGTVHQDEIQSPESTASSATQASPPLPAIFTSLLPSSPFLRSAILTFPVYGIVDGKAESAVGARWVALDATSGTAGKPWTYHIYSWIRALQISRTTASGSFKVDHYDVATNYKQTTATGKAMRTPYEHISDDYNEATHTDWHEDRTFDGNAAWNGTAVFTGADGKTRSVTTSWNMDTDVRTKTITFTNAKGLKVVITLNYNANDSGTGTVTVNSKQVATLAWDSKFKGTATYAGGKNVKSYRAPRF